MRRIVIILLSAVMLSGLCACGGSETGGGTGGETAALSGTAEVPEVICTIFPVYDWVRNIAGSGGADVSMLLDGGTDLHSYQLTAEDIVRISQCDLFVYVGGVSDEWVKDVLASSGAKCRALDLMDALSAELLEEETVEGMQAESGGTHAHQAEYDEHIWLSLRRASAACDAICGALSDVRPGSAKLYRANTDAYKAELSALDGEFSQFINSVEGGRVALFADRFPFRYFTQDYGIEYFAAFAGCSAETEASFETISFLAGKVDEYDLKYVFNLEGPANGIAQTVINNSASKTAVALTLDSMQSVTAEEVDSGEDYLEIMRLNCEKFREAFGE